MSITLDTLDSTQTSAESVAALDASPCTPMRVALAWMLRRQPLWRSPTYLVLWASKIVSATGSQMSQIAFPLLVLALTRSAAIAGLAGALRMLPYLLLSLPAGALVDRWDRRRVLVICEGARAIALATIPAAILLGHLSVAQIFVVAVVEGTFFVFFDLAEVSVLPAVVTPAQLPAATAQYLSLTDGVTTLLGPALGGALYAAGRMVPFLLDALSYCASFAALRRISLPACAPAAPLTWQSVRGDVVEGVLWVWRHRVLRALTLILGLCNLLVAGEALLVIVLAERLHATTVETGLILGIGGAGTVAGALIGERIAGRWPFLLLFAGTSWLVAGVWLLYALAPTPFALGLVMASLGAIYSVQNVAQFTYRMSLIPSALQGRVNSIIRVLAYGSLPVGIAIIGFSVQRVGPVTTVMGIFSGLIIVAVLVTFLPQFRSRANDLPMTLNA